MITGPGKKKKVMRSKGGTAGGRKLADSGGAYIPSEIATVPKKKVSKLKPKSFTTGGGTKLGATVIKGKVKKY